MRHILPCLTTCTMLLGCSSAPHVKLVAGKFPVSDLSRHAFKKGEPTHGEFGVRFGGVAGDDFIRIAGQWTDQQFTHHDLSGRYYGSAANRYWRIEAHPKATAHQEDAIDHAKDGYAAKLAWTLNASPRICPRFERKTFPWGRAVSFFVQYQNDNTNYVPNNGMLTYEIHGITHGGRYVRAAFGVTHKSLTEFGQGTRHYREGDPADPKNPMRLDPDYRLTETADPHSFQPSLSDIDEFVGTMIIK